ncbi:4'-phosphopantetheinyl transferase family protein [Dongia sp. agr-C8]
MFSAVSGLHLGLMRVDSPAALQAIPRWSTDEDRHSSVRPASLLCRALLRGMLAEITQSPPDAWRFSKGRSGAPVAAHRSGQPAPAISLSHSGPWVAIAATFAGAIGVDVEQARGGRDLGGIAERAFGRQEREAVGRFGSPRFYAIWTLREAIAKATGKGLEMAADRRDRVPDGPTGSARWMRMDDVDWWLMHESPAPEVSFGLAFRPAAGRPRSEAVQLHWWPGEEA